MSVTQWARLNTDVQCDLRRGAWYRVVQLRSLEAVLDVHGKRIVLGRRFLDVAARPPAEWAIIQRPRNAVRIPPSWGESYAVCPNCRNRAPVSGRPSKMRCGRCNGLFEISWDRPYRGKTSASVG